MELKRKTFHITSIILPISYFFCEKLAMSAILTCVFFTTLYLDLKRHKNEKIAFFIEKFFGKMMRIHEKQHFSGITYFLAGIFVSCLISDKYLAITSWFVLSIADAISGIICKRSTSDDGKPYQSAIAFFTITFLISYYMNIYSKLSTTFISIVLASLATTYVEYKSQNLFNKGIRIDDNLSIPITYCFVTQICNVIF